MKLKNLMTAFSSFIILLVTFSGCAGINSITSEASQKTTKQAVKKDATKKAKIYGLFKGRIKPGEVSLLKVEGPFIKKGILTCDNHHIDYFIKDNKLLSFLSESYFSDMKPFDCYYNDKKHTPIKIAEFRVIRKKFPSETLKVDKKRVFPNKKNAARAGRERRLRAKAYNNSPNRPYFFTAFKKPINSLVTSIYGSKRIFNNKKQTQHLGTDYRAAVGTPIRAANRGKVVISRDFFYTGNTIIIDHGLGIFTTYGHLSKRNVQEGEIIPEGTIIGEAGATGRVTGPHLHWGVTVNNLAVEGDSLIKASQKIGE